MATTLSYMWHRKTWYCGTEKRDTVAPQHQCSELRVRKTNHWSAGVVLSITGVKFHSAGVALYILQSATRALRTGWVKFENFDLVRVFSFITLHGEVLIRNVSISWQLKVGKWKTTNGTNIWELAEYGKRNKHIKRAKYLFVRTLFVPFVRSVCL